MAILTEELKEKILMEWIRIKKEEKFIDSETEEAVNYSCYSKYKLKILSTDLIENEDMQELNKLRQNYREEMKQTGSVVPWRNPMWMITTNFGAFFDKEDATHWKENEEVNAKIRESSDCWWLIK